MNNKTKLILGLVGAAAAGVIVGLMLAPEKGTDMRKRISRTAGDWADHLTDLFANAKGELQNLRNKGARGARNMAGEAENRFNSATESFNS